MTDEPPVETLEELVARFEAVSDDELEKAVNVVKADAYDHVVTIGRYNNELGQLQRQYDAVLARLGALLKLQEARAAGAPPNRAARRAKPAKAAGKRAPARKRR